MAINLLQSVKDRDPSFSWSPLLMSLAKFNKSVGEGLLTVNRNVQFHGFLLLKNNTIPGQATAPSNYAINQRALQS